MQLEAFITEEESSLSVLTPSRSFVLQDHRALRQLRKWLRQRRKRFETDVSEESEDFDEERQ